MESQVNISLKGQKRTKLSLTPVQLIVLAYLLFAALGTILLSLPFSRFDGVELSLIDALFTATSAISVTGLTVVSTPDTFNLVGRTILAVLLQFGGIGIMTLGTLVYVLRGNQVNLRNRMMIRADQNQTSLQGMVVLMLFIFKIAIIFELIGATILTFNFWYTHQIPFINALGMGVFHGISAFTNAGFDLFGNSLQNFEEDYLMQSVIGMLLILGAIGFPVLLEVNTYIKSRRNNTKFKFSLYTKLTTLTFGALLIAGFLIVLGSEISGSLAGMPWHQKISVAFFHSLNTRNGGFSTIDVSIFRNATLMFFCMLMFIGASPSSCGGGIRTTTFAVIILAVISFLRGRSSVKVFRRELFSEDIMRAFSVFFVAAMLVFVAIIILMEIEPFSTTEILFEVCSAFGTTGLSMGITEELSTVGKAVIIFLMFIGRIGIISLLLLFQKSRIDERYHYVKERIIIG